MEVLDAGLDAVENVPAGVVIELDHAELGRWGGREVLEQRQVALASRTLVERSRVHPRCPRPEWVIAHYAILQVKSLDLVAEPAEQRRHILTCSGDPVEVDLQRDVVAKLLGEELVRREAAEAGKELLGVIVVPDREGRGRSLARRRR